MYMLHLLLFPCCLFDASLPLKATNTVCFPLQRGGQSSTYSSIAFCILRFDCNAGKIEIMRALIKAKYWGKGLLIKSFIQIIHLDIDKMINAGLRFGLRKKQKLRGSKEKTEENKLHLLFSCAQVESCYSTGVNELGHWDKHEWSLNFLIIITLEMFFVQFCYRVNERNCCIWGWEQKIGVINLLIFIQ